MSQITQSIVNEVANTIQGLTNSQELFTAYDITCILRRKGIANLPGHWELKEVVHDMYLTGNMDSDYTRSTVTLTVGGPATLVYHSYTSDVNNYDRSKFTSGMTVATPAPVAVPIATPVNHIITVKPGPDQVKADARGRIVVPKRFVSMVNWQGTVVASVNPNQVTLSKAALSKSDTVLTVDQYGNVKVSLGKNKAGSVYQFNVSPGGLVVATFLHN